MPIPVVEETAEGRALTRRCTCGEIVDSTGFTNTCVGCGADYNWAGQRLAPRSQWSDDTGESVSDILAIDAKTVEELFDGDEELFDGDD